MAAVDFSSVPGNAELRRRLARNIREGSLGHAYIIEGPGMVRELAIELARAVNCTGGGALPCGECPSCRRAEVGSHPDICVVSRGDRATLGVEAIRTVREDAYIIPSEGERKVYIIEDADTMTVEAQNAFLLTLEEPPEYVLYLLLCRRSDALLPTVRSRAPSLRLRPCTADELSDYVLRVGGARARALRDREPDKFSELLLISGGDPSAAAALLEGGALDERISEKKSAQRLLSGLLSGDGEAVIELSQMKKLKRADALGMLVDMEAALRDMLLSCRSRAFDTCFFLSPKDAADAASGIPPRRLAEAADIVRDSASAIEKNAAVTTALSSMAIKIRS